MFIRFKRINNTDYAYLVSNKWHKRKGSTKQRVKKYLGRVLKLGEKKIPHYTLKGNSKSMIRTILNETLSHHGFSIEGNSLVRGNMTINFAKHSIKRKNKEVVLKIKEGHLCSHTLRKLTRFKILPNRDLVEEEGVRLAEAIVQAGLTIPKDQFVKLFEQIWKEQFSD